MITPKTARTLTERVFAELVLAGGVSMRWRDPASVVVTTGSETEAFDLDLDDDASLLIMKVADKLQTIAIESSHSMIPPCPLHPGQHPLSAALSAAEAWWTCPRTGRPIRTVLAS